MFRTTILCFLISLLCATVSVNGQTCHGMAQYAPCSMNSACGCFQMPGAIDVGVCAFLWTTCSELTLCQPPYNLCFQSDHICLNHPRCHNAALCYPVSMIGQNICPPLQVTNTTPTVTATTVSATTTMTSTTAETTTITSTVTTTTSTSGITTTPAVPDIPLNATWLRDAIMVAGNAIQGLGLYQLRSPQGLDVDDDETVVIADTLNHRIVEWKRGATVGRLVAGGKGVGNGLDQLASPTDVIIDKTTNSVFICDQGNRRVVQWSRHIGTTKGGVWIDNIACFGLVMDDKKYLYVTDILYHEVRKYQIGQKTGVLVAGGNGQGDRLNDLDYPTYLFVDQDYSVYVSETNNHRVTKWAAGAKEGIVVAGGHGSGTNLTQLHSPRGVFVDHMGTIFVAESGSARVTRWHQGMTEGIVIAGGNETGGSASQFNNPAGLAFDRQGNLYVTDTSNSRVQRFSIKKN